MFWTNWIELEKHNDWGVRKKNDGTAALWNDGADTWEERSSRELEFTQKQADILKISPDDTILDICCGTGPLTIPLAKKAQHVTALDFSSNMLQYVRQKAERYGLSNISYFQGNWNTMEPSKDYPVADIAVTRHSPAQGNILKFSRCAKRYCYSLCMVPVKDKLFSLFRGGKGRWIKSDCEQDNYDTRPDSRQYGLNIHFNLLYEAGAHPEVRYLYHTDVLSGRTTEELAQRLFPHSERPEVTEYVKAHSKYDGYGIYTLPRTQCMSVMGWDPREIRYDLLEKEGLL